MTRFITSSVAVLFISLIAAGCGDKKKNYYTTGTAPATSSTTTNNNTTTNNPGGSTATTNSTSVSVIATSGAPAPVVNNVAPNEFQLGLPVNGTIPPQIETFSVFGANFRTGASIAPFGNGITIDSVVRVTSTELAVTVTNTNGFSGLLPLTVVNTDGSSFRLGSALTFREVTDPTVGSPLPNTPPVAPSKGVRQGGFTITVLGSNFVQGITTVSLVLNGNTFQVPANDVTVQNMGQLEFVMPALTESGNYDLIITNGTMSFVAVSAFTAEETLVLEGTVTYSDDRVSTGEEMKIFFSFPTTTADGLSYEDVYGNVSFKNGNQVIQQKLLQTVYNPSTNRFEGSVNLSRAAEEITFEAIPYRLINGQFTPVQTQSQVLQRPALGSTGFVPTKTEVFRLYAQ